MNALCLVVGCVFLFVAHYFGFRQRKSEGHRRLNDFRVHWGIGGRYLEELRSGCATLMFKMLGFVCAFIGLGLTLKGCGVLDEYADSRSDVSVEENVSPGSDGGK